MKRKSTERGGAMPSDSHITPMASDSPTALASASGSSVSRLAKGQVNRYRRKRLNTTTTSPSAPQMTMGVRRMYSAGTVPSKRSHNATQ